MENYGTKINVVTFIFMLYFLPVKLKKIYKNSKKWLLSNAINLF